MRVQAAQVAASPGILSRAGSAGRRDEDAEGAAGAEGDDEERN